MSNKLKEMDVHYSSKTYEWETPQPLFDELNKEFNFTLDVCANEQNKKLPKFYSKEQDSLKQSWEGERCWMNPPYGRQIGNWIRKAASGEAEIVVCLLPARTDTKWFHDYIYRKAEIRFVKGRIQFINGGKLDNAPFPNMIVIFKSHV